MLSTTEPSGGQLLTFLFGFVAWFACVLIFGKCGQMIGRRKSFSDDGAILGGLLGPAGVLIAWLAQGNRKECSSCFELIQRRAKACPYCARPQPEEPPPTTEPDPSDVQSKDAMALTSVGRCARCRSASQLQAVRTQRGEVWLCPTCAGQTQA
jgi:hypothetical protein